MADVDKIEPLYGFHANGGEVDNSAFEAAFNHDKTDTVVLTLVFDGDGVEVPSDERIKDETLLTSASLTIGDYTATLPPGSVSMQDGETLDSMGFQVDADDSAPKVGEYSLFRIIVSAKAFKKDYVVSGQSTRSAVETWTALPEAGTEQTSIDVRFSHPDASKPFYGGAITARGTSLQVTKSDAPAFQPGAYSGPLDYKELWALGAHVTACISPRGFIGFNEMYDISNEADRPRMAWMGENGLFGRDLKLKRVQETASRENAQYRLIEVDIAFNNEYMVGQQRGSYFVSILENESGQSKVEIVGREGGPNINDKRENYPCPLGEWMSIDRFT
ncbi:hypothetical protein [Ruegeria sp. HKCCSP335]|uniref:hypothetical protein n=1 Tax=Ruegeria sp. HKCCSP335 TaxID=2794833 RepID=UPI001AE6B95C|nr:hypothetical protein [Ruegeria sp. HKCCSP335]